MNRPSSVPGALLLLLLGTSAPSAVRAQLPGEADRPPGTIQGAILGEQGSDTLPLANAIVSVSSGNRHVTITTDSNGRYRIPGLSPGAWRVRAVHVGYQSLSAAVQVPSRGVVTLDLSLNWEPVRLPALLVRGHGLGRLSPRETAPNSELGEVALRALEGTSGMVEGGLAQVVRNLPGNDPSDPQDVLLMRGSAADLKLVLLDGAPIYTPFHMAGLVESFDPQALGGASLFLGGAPARFDGGLSYILDLHARSPATDEVRGTAALDLLTGRLLLEGPIGSSTGFMVGARALHNLGTSLLAQGPSPYGFGDLLARFEWTGSNDQKAYVTGFWNQESVFFELSDDAAAVLDQEQALGNAGLLGGSSGDDGAKWGNQALSASYHGKLGGTRFELRVAGSRYEAELPVGDTLPILAQSRSDRTRLTADFSRAWGDGSIRFGTGMDWLQSDYSAMALDSAQVGAMNRVELDGSMGGAYLEVSQPLTPSLSVRGGGRLDRFRGESRLRWAPRLALTWMLTDEAALTLAAGRYHQYSNVTSEELQENLAPDSGRSPSWGSDPLQLSVGSANHLVVSLDQILTPGLRLGLEGFFKEFSGVPGAAGQSLNASGVDLRVAREGERASGWLGYTLTWFWASGGILASRDSPFSGRHLLSAGLTTALTNRTGIRLKASYGDGLPFTSIPVPGAEVSAPALSTTRTLNVAGDQVLNSAPELAVGPDEGFLRLEVELFGRWSPTISGRTMDLRPYLRVINALNRRDALFYHFDPWRNEGPQPLADLPFLPLVGLEWRF